MRILRYIQIGAGLLAGALLWPCVAYNLAAAQVEAENPLMALRILPGSSSATSLAAEQALVRNDFRAASFYARQALRSVPRDVRALRVLGLAEIAQGDARLGAEFMLRAGALSWRDDPTQLWLIQQAVAQRNYETAAERIDAMLRREAATKPLLTALHGLAMLPEARQAIVERLVASPSWRGSFFHKTELLTEETIAGHAAILGALTGSAAPPTRDEMVWFVSRLVGLGHVHEARRLWLSHIPRAEREQVTQIADGDFTLDPRDPALQPRYPFEWRLRDNEGAFALVDSPPMLVGERSLRAEADGTASVVIAEQTLMLAPGAGALHYDALAASGLKPEAFEWRIVCLPGGHEVQLSPVTAQLVGHWKHATQSFAVPASGCGAQELRLTTRPVAGDGPRAAWFDRVRIGG